MRRKKIKNITLSIVMIISCFVTMIVFASCKGSQKEIEEVRSQFNEGISTYSYDEAEKERVFASTPFVPTKIYVGTQTIATAPHYTATDNNVKE